MARQTRSASTAKARQTSRPAPVVADVAPTAFALPDPKPVPDALVVTDTTSQQQARPSADVLAEVLAKPIPRPVTCGSWVKLHPTDEKAAGRLVTCKRLPCHKGECRAHLTIAAEHKATSPKATAKAATAKVGKGRVTREALLKAAEKLASGEMTPSAYMSLVSRFGAVKARKALVVAETAPVAETAVA